MRRSSLGLACLALSLALGARASAQDQPPRTVVADLAYGEVLFYFYQENYFAALTRLLAAQVRDELPNHAIDGELLLGGLYLSYGQHRIAGQIFERLLASAGNAELHDRAWFFLAKIWHQRGYVDEAAAALERIGAPLPPELEPERRMLHAQVLMAQGRFTEAAALLTDWPDENAHWLAYAKYNLGVALVRLGRVAEGAGVLEEAGRLPANGDAELAALRDKANVALGYAWLQAGVPEAAKPSLQRVRLSGPYSNKALLGVGWADAEQENYRAALAPWVELRGRSLLDSAVQESLLAVPYAYARLGADAEAADHYLTAIESFDTEIARLDAAIEAIEHGELIGALLESGAADGTGWYWRLEHLPDTLESRYLYELMSTHRFQEALKNYRDMGFLNANLEEWSRSLGAFDDILDTKQRAYEQRLPRINEHLALTDVAALAERRVALQSALQSVERNRDIVALGTPYQQRLWRELEGMELPLALLGDDDPAQDLRDKQRLLEGLLLWELDKDYKLRLWRAQRNLRDLELQIRAADRLELRIRTARDEWPEQFREQVAHVAALSARVADVMGVARGVLARQQRYVQQIAVEELLAQRERLETYRVQARFSLAAIYDRAAVNLPDASAPAALEDQP